jgi:hypothetical protein
LDQFQVIKYLNQVIFVDSSNICLIQVINYLKLIQEKFYYLILAKFFFCVRNFLVAVGNRHELLENKKTKAAKRWEERRCSEDKTIDDCEYEPFLVLANANGWVYDGLGLERGLQNCIKI